MALVSEDRCVDILYGFARSFQNLQEPVLRKPQAPGDIEAAVFDA